MPKTITTTDLFEPINVELWGSKFRLREGTRTVEEKMQAQWEAFEQLPEDAPAKDSIEPLADLLDILLEPLGDEDGKKVAAKTVIKREYKADNIGLAHVIALCERMGEASGRRPT